MKVKVYLISLKNSSERRDRLLQELSHYSFLDIEWVEAVNGYLLTAEERDRLFDWKEFIYRYGREPLSGEIGCTLSHRECYRRLLCSEHEVALILEDDVRFLYPEMVEPVLGRVIEMFSSGGSMLVTLTRHDIYYTKKLSGIGEFSFYRLWSAMGTCAYLLNKQACRTILSSGKPFIVADDFEYISICGVFVQGIYPTFASDASSMEEIESDIVRDEFIEYKLHQSFINSCRYYATGKYRGLLFRLGLLSRRKINYGRN